MSENNLSHIKFGFRGEGIIYKLDSKEYELWSTYINGIRIYLDDLRKTDLNEGQKTKMFKEIIQFVTQKDKKRPIICYNSDYSDADLWKKLAIEFSSEIENTEITTIEKENEALYETISDSLKTGKAIHKFENGLEIRSIKYLDKYWDYIKIKKDSEISQSIPFWNKWLAKMNF